MTCAPWRSRADRNVRSAPGRLTGDVWLGSGPGSESAAVVASCKTCGAVNCWGLSSCARLQAAHLRNSIVHNKSETEIDLCVDSLLVAPVHLVCLVAIAAGFPGERLPQGRFVP